MFLHFNMNNLNAIIMVLKLYYFCWQNARFFCSGLRFRIVSNIRIRIQHFQV
jgi:hypothetical protein